MPANLSPEYKKAEQAFRAARDDRERLGCLKEMLRTIPKHKGTEHLQADIKSRIKQLTEELAGPRKGAARTGPVHSVRPEGAAQIALLGPPNAGKSALHARLTGSRAESGPYPYATHEPLPGMLAWEDIHFQLVDLPPISEEWFEGWFITALQNADAALLVVDITDPDCTDQVAVVLNRLGEKRVFLTPRWPGDDDPATAQASGNQAAGGSEDAEPDPFRIDLPTLLIAGKSDLHHDPADIRVLKELLDVRFPSIDVSAETGAGLDQIGPFLFRQLGVARVYTKAPGKPVDRDKPFTVRHGATVQDVARLVHKDIASSLRYARAWGREVYDGQQVGPDHAVSDGDVIELHMH
jgi:uncharacterized protein